MYLAGTWRTLRLRNAEAPAFPAGCVTDSLDVSLLQNLLLEPVLGISDPRRDKRLEFVGGIRGTAELERLVDSGAAAVAFALCPTTMGELLTVADASQLMPPKSTWFEPKLRDGFAVLVFA
jgi:uncharacterized protein (DUF1015 family)